VIRLMLSASAVAAALGVMTMVSAFTAPAAMAHQCPRWCTHNPSGWGSYHCVCSRPRITSRPPVEPRRKKGLRRR
jgi:hypothetical protein